MATPAGTRRATPICATVQWRADRQRRHDARSGQAAIAHGEADLVAIGVPFLANPDLPARYRKMPRSIRRPTTFYAGEEKVTSIIPPSHSE